MMTCPFCDLRSAEMKKRIFYRDRNWFAILAAPFHTKGHTILAAVPADANCPQEPSLRVLEGLPTALAKTIKTLKSVYEPKDVLIESLRGSEGHFHFHLLPLWQDEERTWKNSHTAHERYQKGHLMEFLGYLEKQGDKKAEIERKNAGLSKEQQRKKIVAAQKPDIEKLRLASGYYRR